MAASLRRLRCTAPQEGQAPPPGAARHQMWGCCADSASDDEKHNTRNAFLLLCADALVAPVLLSGLTDVDELMVALGCRFALDILTVAQQDWPPPVPVTLAHDPGHALWV